MTDAVISCPQCGIEIKLTESLAAPLVEAAQKQFEAQRAQERAMLAEREGKVAAAEQRAAEGTRALEAARAALARQEAEIESRANELAAAHAKKMIAKEREGIEREATRLATERSARDLEQRARENAAQKELLARLDAQLAEARSKEAGFLRREREIAEKERDMALAIEKQVGERLEEIETRAARRAAEQSEMAMADKDKKLADSARQIAEMARQMEEMRRKAEQGSQQHQGEVQELVLEAVLRTRFPGDTIEEVGKGEFGGDVVQRVAGAGGVIAGVMLWESKRTRSWSDGWLAKLREDSRRAQADAAIIVSQALPKSVETFALVEGVWVAAPRYAGALGACIREGIIQTASARQAAQGQQTKMGLVYEYLTGPGFRRRLEAIVEAYTGMQEDLEKEKKAMMAQWNKRAKQLELALHAAAGMHGDLAGIAGSTLPQIEGLGLKLLSE